MRTLLITILSLLAVFPAGAQKTKAPAPDPNMLLEKARTALANYDFVEVQSLMSSYYTALNKATEADDAAAIAHAGELGEKMLERVEKIVVIDSIIVDKDKFFEAYKLSPAAGSLQPSSDAGNSPIYMPQNGGTELFASPKAEGGNLAITSARVLADGSLEEARVYPNPEGIDNAAYPYLMPDGLTLYFAGTGEQSLGGYDIFITRRSNVDDDFLQPQNLGMPFNSPYDDYMLVIDEATGIGWWATDRNRLDGKLTIYMYIPQELRVNLDTENPDLINLAALRSIAATHPEGFTKPDIAKLVHDATPASWTQEFKFALPGGKVITSVSELSSRRSQELMQEYLEERKDVEFDRNRLATLRMKYRAGDQSVAKEILNLESALEEADSNLLRLSNEIVKSEQR